MSKELVKIPEEDYKKIMELFKKLFVIFNNQRKENNEY